MFWFFFLLSPFLINHFSSTVKRQHVTGTPATEQVVSYNPELLLSLYVAPHS